MAVDSAVPIAAADFLPLQLLGVSEGSHPSRALERLRAVAISDACGLDERVELGLIEKPDVLVAVLGIRLLCKLARILMRPALANCKVEDAVEESQVVECALDRMARETLLDEILNVVDSDVGDRHLTEVRDEMHSQAALVVAKG
jgi:hypothetical protein